MQRKLNRKDYKKAANYYAAYLLDNGKALPVNKQREYTVNAYVLNAVSAMSDDKTARCKALGGTGSQWPAIAKAVATLPSDKWPHTLPNNERRLRQKLRDYKEGGYESLIHANFCNSHSQKLSNDDKR